MSLTINVDATQAQADHALSGNGRDPHPSPGDALDNPNFGTYYAGAISGLIARLGSPTSFTARQEYSQLALDVAIIMHREETMLRATYRNQSGAKQSERIRDALAGSKPPDSRNSTSRGVGRVRGRGSN